MSSRLRSDQCCLALVDKKRCTKPATELGGLCLAHWKALSPQSRSYLEWEAAWTVPQSDARKAPMVVATIMEEPKTLQERFTAYYEQREVLRLYRDLARFEAGT